MLFGLGAIGRQSYLSGQQVRSAGSDGDAEGLASVRSCSPLAVYGLPTSRAQCIAFGRPASLLTSRWLCRMAVERTRMAGTGEAVHPAVRFCPWCRLPQTKPDGQLRVKAWVQGAGTRTAITDFPKDNRGDAN